MFEHYKIELKQCGFYTYANTLHSGSDVSPTYKLSCRHTLYLHAFTYLIFENVTKQRT